MNLSDAITSALPLLRAEAEARMLDGCIVTRAGAGPGSVNEADGTVTPPASTTVYSGPCRVQVPQGVEQDTDSGGEWLSVQAVVVSLPVDGSGGVEIGDRVTVTACAFDASLVRVDYVVRGLHRKTDATARRLRCEEAN